MSQFDNVSVINKANIYFDGQCVSHTVLFPDGSRKTLGVIFPGKLTFNTAAAEVAEINAVPAGFACKGEDDWTTYTAGQQFSVPANSGFDIETIDTLDYVCHFG